MSLDLPLHPSMHHPLTGEPLRALYVDKTGRARFPIMGAAEDGDEGEDTDSSNDGEGSGDDKSKEAEAGFPANTPVAEMTAEQQAAYHLHQARKHEDRNKEWQRVAGGKTAEQIKADQDELETLRAGQRTESENAVEEARKATRTEVLQEFGTKLAAAEFRAALGHVDGERRDQIIDGINLSNYLTTDGDVDTDKVKSYAAAIAPADTGAGGNRSDYGAGRRTDTKKSGVNAGADMFAEKHKKQSASST